MINANEVTTLVSGSKNLITEQNYYHLTEKLNTTGVAFDVSEGLGDATSTSSVVLINSGGYDDQKITAVLNFPSPTTAGSEDIGVILRCLTFDSTDDTYYYARVDGGIAKITRVLDNSWVTLTSQAFALAQGTNVTITFSAVGDALNATFDAGGSPATVNLSTTDSNIPGGGVMGFRSNASTVWCRDLIWEQL
jgi:hypothetical protein